jgi:hypothetical protein
LFAVQEIRTTLKYDPENVAAIRLNEKIDSITKDREPPVIDIAEDAVLGSNQQTFVKSIKVSDNVALKNVYVDDVEQQMVMLQSAECFVSKPLKDNFTKVNIKAVDMNNNETVKQFSVVFDQLPPVIKILTPQTKEFTTKNDVVTLLIMVTDDIGLKEIEVGKDRKELSGKEYNYSGNVVLKEGKNAIKVVVTDIAGNITTEFIDAVYEREKLAIAIADFKSGEGVDAYTAVQTANKLRSELVQTNGFKVINREDMTTLLSEQQIQLSDCTDESCAVKMGRMLAAKKVIIGVIDYFIDIYRIEIRFVDVETGLIMDTFEQKFKVLGSEPIETACKMLAQQLYDKHGTK